MDSETVHGTVSLALAACRKPGRYSGSQWTLVEAAEAWRRAASVAPRTDWQSLPEKGLNTATGAAGEGCNEKAAFITPGIQKAE